MHVVYAIKENEADKTWLERGYPNPRWSELKNWTTGIRVLRWEKSKIREENNWACMKE